jgi:hypothetical protein
MKPLTNNLELHTAAADRKEIAVFIRKERIGKGVIAEITEASVKIGDDWFMRENCSFWLESR